MKLIKFLTSKSFWIQLGVILLLAVVSVLLLFQYLKIHTNHNNYITLNDLSGLTMDQVIEQLDDRKLNYSILDSNSYLDTLLPRSVYKQNPDPGSKVKESRTIYLWINASEPPLVEVPDIVGKMSYNMAIVKLKNRKFEIGQITHKPSEEENSILSVMIDSVEVQPGLKVRQGTVVDLVVAGGAGSTRIEVPCLLGKTLREAKFIIANNDLQIGSESYDSTDITDYESAVIRKQLPACGNGVIKVGESIDIFLSQDLPASVVNKLKEDSLNNEDGLNADSE